MASPGLTLDEAARFLGHATWLERRLFEIVGGWVPSTPEPAVKLAFARQSRHHGWHAQLLAPLRPHTRDHEPEAQTVPLDDGWRDRLAQLTGATSTPARVAGLAEVLARACAEGEDTLGAMRPFRDAPAMRALRLVLEDAALDLGELGSLDDRAKEAAR